MRSGRTMRRGGAAACRLAGMAFYPVTIVYGGNEFLGSQRIRELKRQARASFPDADEVELQGASVTEADFYDAVSPSFLAAQSIVTLLDLQDIDPSVGERIAAYTAEVTKDPAGAEAVLICRHDGGMKGKRILDAMVKAGAYKDPIPDLRKPKAQVNFVLQRFQSLNRSIDYRAAQQLAAIMGDNPGELYAMCEQLCMDFDDNPITLQIVNEYMTADPQTTGFDVADTAAAGDVPGAIVKMRAAVEQGIAPTVIVGALAGRMRSLAKVGALVSGDINESQVGAPEWKIPQLRSELRGWDGHGMSACFEALTEADSQSKSNQGDPVYALERAIECIGSKGRMR